MTGVTILFESWSRCYKAYQVLMPWGQNIAALY